MSEGALVHWGSFMPPSPQTADGPCGTSLACVPERNKLPGCRSPALQQVAGSHPNAFTMHREPWNVGGRDRGSPERGCNKRLGAEPRANDQGRRRQ